MMLFHHLLSLFAVANTANALAFTATPKTAPIASSSSSIYHGLASTPLIRAFDKRPVALTELWRANTPFGGIADEYAVCAFLRHYG